MEPWYLLWEYTPSQRQRRDIRIEFDRTFGVDTAHEVDICDLAIESPNWEFGVRYEPTAPERFIEMVGSLPIKYEDFTFIDVGSGKGKVLLMASEMPFKRIIGIEFSPMLNRIAQNNISRYKSPTQICTSLESICIDAIDYAIPPEKIVFYFYNPFHGCVLSEVLKNIEKSLIDNPREILVVYYNPVHKDLFDNSQFLTQIKSSKFFSIYTTAEMVIILYIQITTLIHILLEHWAKISTGYVQIN
jgi:hypothetical protein